ncbi:MAG: hypothetical protein H0W88_02670 [Parachlamydiaceae bacterium]|nr:hypothetical protein [Parachlamydiaceae bacterium]
MVINRNLSAIWNVRVGIWLTLLLIMGAKIESAQNGEIPTGSTVLQGSIFLQSEKSEEENKVQPGKEVKLKLIIENKGKIANSSGKVFIRFGYAAPLDTQPNSVLFQTEQVDLPSIEPGKKVEIDFTKSHQWPSVLDFVKYDWLMREYQVVVVIDKKEKVIGSLAVTFSAYYYPGIRKELQVAVPCVQ